MSRKLWISALAVGLAAASAGALADHNSGEYRYDDRDERYGEYDYARVTGVEPLRRRVRISEPVRECWDEVSYAPDNYSDRAFSSNHVGGTLVGGVLGNQVGSGSGRQVARAAGAIIGGAIGHNVSRERQRQRYGDQTYRDERVVERCETRHRESYEERIDGYDVTYVYAGREYHTRMPYDPGDRIRIRVDVTPTGG